MTTFIMTDDELGPDAVTRRLREEMARRGIRSDAQAAQRYGRPQQWVSRHMAGQTDWKLRELQHFCEVLNMDYRYVLAGVRSGNPTGGGEPVAPTNYEPDGWAAAA